MRKQEYNRQNVVKYAEKWAYSRNPEYYNFDSVGGDCTAFVSQCIYAGSKIMNYNKINGWYYINGNKKSPSWSGVEFLYNFLIENNETGPVGEIAEINKIQIGDIAQLSFDGIKFSHTLVIVRILERLNLDNILVATHTFDSYGRAISTYNFLKIRFVHIKTVNV